MQRMIQYELYHWQSFGATDKVESEAIALIAPNEATKPGGASIATTMVCSHLLAHGRHKAIYLLAEVVADYAAHPVVVGVAGRVDCLEVHAPPILLARSMRSYS